jgi:hypothetical protein
MNETHTNKTGQDLFMLNMSKGIVYCGHWIASRQIDKVALAS